MFLLLSKGGVVGDGSAGCCRLESASLWSSSSSVSSSGPRVSSPAEMPSSCSGIGCRLLLLLLANSSCESAVGDDVGGGVRGIDGPWVSEFLGGGGQTGKACCPGWVCGFVCVVVCGPGLGSISGLVFK